MTSDTFMPVTPVRICAPAAEKKSEKAKKPPTEAQKKQQERMRQCSADAKAKGIKSKEERNKFMSACLKG